MSTPQSQPQPSKGPRRSARRSKNTHTGVSEPDHTVSDSGPSPTGPDHVATRPGKAPIQASTDADNQKKRTQFSKKSNNTPKAERTSHHQHAPSQPNLTYSSHRQGTPIKQAYAGPTFHSSPAPSSLPMPSFYSKSMPAVPTTKTPDIAEELETRSGISPATGVAAVANEGTARKRESTPLDFLFDAARQARETPQAESPASRSANLSTYGDSPVSRSPAPREGGNESVFPFELDGNGGHASSIGPAFATPYKERLNALRSSSASPSTTPPILDEEERRFKSEALKKLLMNAQSQSHRAQPPPNYPTDMGNPFNARAPELRNTNQSFHQMRPQSGPSTPLPYSYATGPPQFFPTMPSPHEPRINGSPMHRPASSHLRRQYQVQNDYRPVELSSDRNLQSGMISTARKDTDHSLFSHQANNTGVSTVPRTNQKSDHRPTHSNQQLEDDLRRVLKLDLTSRG